MWPRLRRSGAIAKSGHESLAHTTQFCPDFIGFLHKMSDSKLYKEYEKVRGELHAHWQRQGSRAFRSALKRFVAVAEAGNMDAAEFLGEIYAQQDGPHYDPEAAYKWYYIALSQRGYNVDFNDQNHKPPYYCGPVGDFRNEAAVSGLVDKLGFDRVRQLDAEAAAWLAARKLSPRHKRRS
jgi:hypothetical protein